MKKSYLKFCTGGILTLAMTALAACASTSPELDKKVNAETAVQGRTGLRDEATGLIQSSTSLNPDQKTNLLSLRDSTRKELDQLQQESVKLRAVLIKDVLGAQYNEKEVDKIKTRMSAVEKKKLAVIFNTVDRANKIIGRVSLEDQDKFFDNMFFFDNSQSAH